MIEKRSSLWEERKYFVVESGPGWQIERPGSVPRKAPDLDLLIKNAFRKKRKWE